MFETGSTTDPTQAFVARIELTPELRNAAIAADIEELRIAAAAAIEVCSDGVSVTVVERDLSYVLTFHGREYHHRLQPVLEAAVHAAVRGRLILAFPLVVELLTPGGEER
jgi:hypothetical protein